jgi:large subunit ribosomal protein L35Ae
MQGKITSYRRSIKRTSQKHMIIELAGVTTREDAQKLVGKKVTFNTGKKNLAGKVASAHGKKGAVRAIFETGMPGQSIGAKVEIG